MTRVWLSTERRTYFYPLVSYKDTAICVLECIDDDGTLRTFGMGAIQQLQKYYESMTQTTLVAARLQGQLTAAEYETARSLLP